MNLWLNTCFYLILSASVTNLWVAYIHINIHLLLRFFHILMIEHMFVSDLISIRDNLWVAYIHINIHLLLRFFHILMIEHMFLSYLSESVTICKLHTVRINSLHFCIYLSWNICFIVSTSMRRIRLVHMHVCKQYEIYTEKRSDL